MPLRQQNSYLLFNTLNFLCREIILTAVFHSDSLLRNLYKNKLGEYLLLPIPSCFVFFLHYLLNYIVNIKLNKLSLAGLLIALGIIYGDIGTSPLYVFNAIIGNRVIDEKLILGSLSCIIWTLTLQTTIKYVILTLKADNKGEGGIFSLYALVRRRRKWLVVPASRPARAGREHSRYALVAAATVRHRPQGQPPRADGRSKTRSQPRPSRRSARPP